MNTDPQLGDDLEALEALADIHALDRNSAAFGVALQWLHEGEESLSEKQLRLFNSLIRPIVGRKCGVCENGMDLSSLVNAYETGSMLCSHHLYQYLKND